MKYITVTTLLLWMSYLSFKKSVRNSEIELRNLKRIIIEDFVLRFIIKVAGKEEMFEKRVRLRTLF